MKVIKTMGLRIVNVFDIPGQVPYAFEEPDLRTEEAREMVSGVPIALYSAFVSTLLVTESYPETD